MSLVNKTNNVRPTLQLLSEEQIQQIHKYSISILEHTGIKVESKSALEIFKRSNSVRIDGEIAYIQKDIIDYSISVSPSNIEVYNKSGKLAFNLGNQQGTETLFGIGVTNPFFQEVEKNEIVPFSRRHMQHTAKLGDMLNNFDMVSTLGVPKDVEAGKLDVFSTLDMYANTSKPLVLLISEDNRIDDVFDLLHSLHGDISSKPFCIPYLNPITPLVLNKSTSDKMIASIKNNLPVMYSNYSMYGGSTPVNEGGSLALLNAELLAGLVFSQLVKEGSPMILGSLPASFNMRTMGSRYTTSTYLLNLACSEMMDFYQIPHCGTSGSNNGWGPDLKASADFWMNHLSSCIGKVGCAPFVGGNFDSLALSPANIVLSNHIIGEARAFAKGFNISKEDINIEEIHQVGHGGNYFTSPDTLDHISKLSESDDFWPSENLDGWLRKGKPNTDDVLKEITMDLLTKASIASEENIDIINKGEEYIKSISH